MKILNEVEKKEVNEEYRKVSKISRTTERFVMEYYEYIHKYHSYGTEGNVHKLSMMEIHSLTMIEEQPGITITDLSEIWQKTLSAMSQMVAKLEKIGYVEKRVDAKDAKINRIYVTEVGENLSFAHKQFDIKNIQRKLNLLMTRSSEAEVETLFKMLDIYADILEHEM